MNNISQLILGQSGCVSYIIHCNKNKEAAIVDSFEGYEDVIEKELERLENPSLKYVIDTHTHADRRSSSRYFCDKYKIKGIVKSENTKYKGKIIKTKDEDVIYVGKIKIKVLFTPGHTYDHNCYLINEVALLAGDCLFIGDVGRIDLGGDPKEKADLLFSSLRRLKNLPKNTKIYPNHVGAAHAIDSEDTFSTIGNEIETNKAIQISNKEEFYKYMTEGWPSKPEDWEKIIEDNLNG